MEAAAEETAGAAAYPPPPPRRHHRHRHHHRSSSRRSAAVDPALLPALPLDGDWFTVPPLASLAALPDPATALAALPGFSVGRTGVGEVAFLAPVDVRGLDMGAVLTIQPGQVTAYDGWAEEGGGGDLGADTPRRRVKPRPGAGLNAPALVTLRGMRPPPSSSSKRKAGDPPSARSIAKFGARLAAAATAAGRTHVHYDGDAWTVKVDGF